MSRLRLLLGISLFWLALSILFDGLTTLVLPYQMLRLASDAHKATLLGLLTFVGLLVGLLVQPPAGALSDHLRSRWGRRGLIGIGVAFILAGLALFGAAQDLAMLLAAFVLLHGAAGLAQAAQQGFIPDLVTPPQRGLAAGFKGFMDVGGALLAFLVLGQFLGAGQLGAALLSLAVAVIVTFALTVALVREVPRPAAPPATGVRLADAFRLDLRRHRAFAGLVAARFLFLLGTYAVGRFFLFFVADRLGLPPDRAAEEAGTLLAILTLMTVAAVVPAGWAADRFGRLPLMQVGAALSAAGTLALIAAGDAWHILLAGGLMALGSAAFASANWALTADLAPPAEAARFFGLANIGTAGAAAMAGLLGPLIDWVNLRSPGTGYAALFVVAGLATIASLLPLRALVAPVARLGAAPAPEAGPSPAARH
jgi:MFS family permease